MFLLNRQQKLNILFAMTALMLLSASATDIYISSLPQMVMDFKVVPSIVNLTLAIYNLGIALGVFFVGEISNRYGRRRCILTGAGLFAGSAFLIAVVPSIYAIIGLRFIQALGAAVIVIVPRLILKDCMNEQEQLHGNGILLMGFMISPAVAPIIGAYLAKFFNWESCFLLSGTLASGLLIYCWNTLPETNSTPIKRFAPVKSYLVSYGRLLIDRSFWNLTAIYAGAVGAYYAFLGVSSYLYIDFWHFTPTAYSYLFIGISLAYLAGNIFMQRLNRHSCKPSRILGYGIFSTLSGTVLVVLSLLLPPTMAIILVTIGVFFMRAANAIISPTTQVRLMNCFSHKSAHALGLNMFLSFLVISLVTWCVTLFPDNPLLSLAVISTVSVTVCSLAFWLVPVINPPEEESPGLILE